MENVYGFTTDDDLFTCISDVEIPPNTGWVTYSIPAVHVETDFRWGSDADDTCYSYQPRSTGTGSVGKSAEAALPTKSKVPSEGNQLQGKLSGNDVVEPARTESESPAEATSSGLRHDTAEILGLFLAVTVAVIGSL